MKLGIYVHIPFCKSHCYYCDFCRIDNASEDKIEKYINAVADEIIQNAEVLGQYEVDSIYFGGGTPGLISSEHICNLLKLLKSCTSVDNDCEITIELNPESVTLEKLIMYKNAGVNRISMGLQSANNDVLKKIGRITSVEIFDKAYKMLIDTGFDNISTDIICGLPGDTFQSFKDTLTYLSNLPHLKHISSYSLEVHEGTQLDFLLKNNFLTLPSEDEEREMKYLLDSTLEKIGFNMYEISNYAKKGYMSRHNTKYWQGSYYLGFGVSSASYINSTRYSNTDDIDEYIKGVAGNTSIRKEVEELSEVDLQKEFVILGLRLASGISVQDFSNKFKVSIYSVFKDQIEKNIANGLLKKHMFGEKEYIKLTSRGQDVANMVWQDFI